MFDDNRKTEIEVEEKVLSDYEKETIFFVRWLSFIIATAISLPIWFLWFNLNGILAVTIFTINFLVPPLYYFRKLIGGYVKEKVTYWWNVINGRIP